MQPNTAMKKLPYETLHETIGILKGLLMFSDNHPPYVQCLMSAVENLEEISTYIGAMQNLWLKIPQKETPITKETVKEETPDNIIAFRRPNNEDH